LAQVFYGLTEFSELSINIYKVTAGI